MGRSRASGREELCQSSVCSVIPVSVSGPLASGWLEASISPLWNLYRGSVAEAGTVAALREKASGETVREVRENGGEPGAVVVKVTLTSESHPTGSSGARTNHQSLSLSQPRRLGS